MKRLVVFGLVAAMIWSLEVVWSSSLEPGTSSRLALQQFGNGREAADELRQFETLKDLAHVVAVGFTVLAAIWALRPWLPQWRSGAHTWEESRRWFRLVTLTPLLALGATGCLKPYDRPQFIEIDTSETGFLIPLEGDATVQAKFQSEEYLKQRKVAAKRIRITHRWSQEGRFWGDGQWIPLVRLVKVNRSPVTREWNTAQSPTGNGAVQRTDRAIWIESGDSVGFSMGFTCTAFISEDDAAKFLYWYPSGSLGELMDQEVRGRIQQSAAEVAARYPLDVLRSKKQEIADAVKRDVTNFFATRGVSITTVGMFGGMTYENPEIQKSIDQTFIAQQLKVVAEAKFEAQKKENARIELEAQGQAEKARREALGLADARKTTAAAEAEALREVNRASLEAQQNPLLLQLKSLEVEKARVEKWDGRYPQWWLGGAAGAGGPSVMFQLPAPTPAVAPVPSRP
ncbi:MAG TPA: SPFH domain-containing protein [Candidatus Saccharimonadales bacterium]|jgi:hypothetical protein|nr:SPFH domain-containing protein [Candidatus Saccharimonadales bacterium]